MVEQLPKNLTNQSELQPTEEKLEVVEIGKESLEKKDTNENLPEINEADREQEMSMLRDRIKSDTDKLNAIRAGLGLKPNNEDIPSLEISKTKLKNMENNQNKNENSEFSEETREQLSNFFTESLRNEKDFVEENIEHIRGIVRDSSIEAFKNLMIFSRAVQKLSRDPRVPEKDRMFLRVHEMNLSPIGATEIVPGVSSYALAVKSVVEELDKLLTKEVSLAIHAYAEKIFLPPSQDYAKHGPEPFDSTLFKRGE